MPPFLPLSMACPWPEELFPLLTDAEGFSLLDKVGVSGFSLTGTSVGQNLRLELFGASEIGVAPYFYRGAAYVFADLCTGTCCFLSVVGIAGLLEKWAFAAKWLGLVGMFSYGIYLVHQPYVIGVGLRIQDEPAWAFFLIVAVVLVVLSAWGILLEKFANAMLVRVIGGKK
jgi:peptidoglycan/LPS O-acetylase OafA/YrhL